MPEDPQPRPGATGQPPAPEPAQEPTQTGGGFINDVKRALTWHIFFRMMISPMAFLAPCCGCGAAITFGRMFGPAGTVFGGLFGVVLGVVLIVVWFLFVVDLLGQSREQAFVERTNREIDEAEASADTAKPAHHLGRPKVAAIDVAPIPLSSGPIIVVDIAGDAATAATRIDAHEDDEEALAAAEALRAKHPRDAAVMACLARTLLRAGRPMEGARIASDALQAAVLAGRMESVGRLLNAFWAHREALAVEPSVAEAIAAHLDADGQTSRAEYFRSGRTSLS